MKTIGLIFGKKMVIVCGGENGEPRVYRARFEDGFEYDVWEDEVMNSPNEFYRPNPPKSVDNFY